MIAEPVLILAPHADDAELGCGGTLAKLLEHDINTYVAVFSNAKESLPTNFSPETLSDECFDAMMTLGLQPSQLLIYDFPVRLFHQYRKEILSVLYDFKHLICPATIILPSINDVHQDHHTISTEGIRVFKDITILGYELVWNCIQSTNNVFIKLEKRHIELKWEALQQYKSQIYLRRHYFSKEFIEGLAKVRGVQINEEYAESFEAIKLKVDNV